MKYMKRTLAFSGLSLVICILYLYQAHESTLCILRCYKSQPIPLQSNMEHNQPAVTTAMNNLINVPRSYKYQDKNNTDDQHDRNVTISRSYPTTKQDLLNTKNSSHKTDTTLAKTEATTADSEVPINTIEDRLSVAVSFDPYGDDVLVYLHIQKTGGSEFIEHLVSAEIPTEHTVSYKHSRSDLPSSRMDTENNRSYTPLCMTSQTGGWKRGKTFFHHEMCPKDWTHPDSDHWLISEKTRGWMCGVHAFYTDFKRCLKIQHTFNRNGIQRASLPEDQRCFHHAVLLRHPLLRFVSEYLHVLKGGCWEGQHSCKKSAAYGMSSIVPECVNHFRCNAFRDKDQFTFEMYAKCRETWSTNRMTTMLADLDDEVICWNKSKYTREEKDRLLLESATSNLLNISYFGISEFPFDSGVLFQETFGVTLRNPVPYLSPMASKAGVFVNSLKFDDNLRQQILANNHLDIVLYELALKVFKKRMASIGRDLDPDVLEYIGTLNALMQI